MKYAWIKKHRDEYSVVRMCSAMRVSTSGFYRWLKAKPSPRAQRTAAIEQAVKKAHQDSNGIYGSRKIAQILKSDETLDSACRNTVAKAMKELGLKSRVARKFKPRTTVSDPTKKPAPNILAQDFKAKAPNQKWVADITYLPTRGGWVYLAVVLDLFSRKIVGWKIGDSLEMTLVTGALRNAIESRRPNTETLIHHSDRGCQYTSKAFQKILRTTNIECSMSGKACCYDNAVAERFFWSLKKECTQFEEFKDLEDAQQSVFRYIELFYNSVRIHKTLEYLSPEQFEKKHHIALAS